MSHYTCIAIPAKDGSLVDLMERYNENREVSTYKRPCYCRSGKLRKMAKEGAESKFGEGFIEKCRSAFPKNGTDEDWKALTGDYFREYDRILNQPLPAADSSCEDCNGSGEVDTNRNPESKWDWYQIGGRWSGAFGGQDESTVGDVLESGGIPFAVVTPEGWHERGRMGWFASVSGEKPAAEWEAQVKAILSALDPKLRAYLLDCHI